jgi:hypothetical protein
MRCDLDSVGSRVQWRALSNMLNLVFEVLIAVVMESSVFWDITPCSLLKVNWCFWGTYRLHLQGQSISQARNQNQGASRTWLIFRYWRWREHFSPKCRLNFNVLHGVIFFHSLYSFIKRKRKGKFFQSFECYVAKSCFTHHIKIM